MSCRPAGHDPGLESPEHWWTVLGDEGFRLFFPLGAAYAALWPFLWVLVFGFDLPLARDIPPSLWHGYEMLVGAFGAALIGFLTTAAPEWTDTVPLRGRALWGLAGLWLCGRVIGLPGWEGAAVVGAIADVAWLSVLVIYLLQLSWRQWSDRLLAFVLWLGILLGCVLMAQTGFFLDNIELAAEAVHLAGFAYLGLLGLALGRVTVPVTNLVLDPSEASSPFRPHPGRLNLAPGLVLVVMIGEVAGVSAAVSGFLMIAAGAAFMDRIAENFIGRAVLQSEILMLAGSSAFAGTGLILAGCALLGAPWSALTGLHAAYVGGLGLGVYAVFSIAGKLHTGQPLGQSFLARFGAGCLACAVFLRLAPDFGFEVPGPFHGLAVVLWSGAFVLWLWDFWPALRRMAAGVS